MIRLRQIALFILLFGLCIFISHAQNEANIWHFGEHAGLDFNNGYPPTVLNVPYFNETTGSAAMSDSLGKLLFSCGAHTIWNRDGEVMQNGNDINGWPGGSQYALILQKPGSDNLYYVFTVAHAYHQYQSGLWYSLVDMELDNGFGAVTSEKNILLAAAWDARDKLIGFRGNNNDYKIITYKDIEDEYAVFSLTEQGINEQPVISPSMYRPHIGIPANMKLSYNKKYLVAAFRDNSGSGTDQLDTFEFLHYDLETDSIKLLHNIIYYDEIGYNICEPNSIEFSPDSKWVYLCYYDWHVAKSYIKQYDMRYIEDSTQFVQSEIIIDSGNVGGLQLARDGKIYLAWNNASEDYVQIIHDPWKKGTACNFEENALYIGFEKVNRFLPNMLLDYLFRFEWQGHCSSEPFFFQSNFIPEPITIQWNFSDPGAGTDSISSELNPVHYFTHAGEFEVNVVVQYPNGRIERTSRVVTVDTSPQPNLGPDTLMCAFGEITLDAGDEEGFYLWSNGSFGQNSNKLTVSDTGWYWVDVTSEVDCTVRDSIYVGLYPKAEIDESNLQIIPTACGGSTGKILGLQIFGTEPLTYEWYDADGNFLSNEIDLENLAVGNYYLHILDGNGCATISEAYTIFDSGDIEVTEVLKDNSHCSQSHGTITVLVNVGNTDDLLYSINNGNTWQTGNPVFINLGSGNYVIRVKDEAGCEGVYENNPVFIEDIPGPQVTNVTTVPEIDYLQNGQIDITAFINEGALYYSVDGGTIFQTNNGTFNNLSAGTYYCLVKDDFGCDSTFFVEVTRTISQLIEAIAGDGNTCIGNAAVVPLKLNNFTGIFKFHVKLTYDTAVLSCDGYINIHPDLENNLQASIITGTDEVIIGWQGETPVTLEENATMLELVFGAKKEGLSVIDWAATAGESAFYNENLEQVSTDYHFGKLRVYLQPEISMAKNKESCEGGEIKTFPFITGGSGYVSYEWFGPNNFYSTEERITISDIKQGQAGIYTLKVTDTINCTDSFDVNVIVHDNPQIAFQEQDTIYAEPNFILEAGSGYESYLWNTGDTTDAIRIFNEGLYSVFVTSTESCKSTDSVTILFGGEPFWMPNAFSPNGDGLNDVFKPVQRYDYVSSYNLSIYNRWGELIFATSDIEQGWDGEHKGKTAPLGTYIYRIVYTAYSTRSETQVKTGQVTLVR